MIQNYSHDLFPVSTTIISAAASQLIDMRAGIGVEIAPEGQAVWAKVGDSTVVATAGTANEIFVAVGTARWIPRGSTFAGLGHVAIIQDALTADGSVTVYG